MDELFSQLTTCFDLKFLISIVILTFIVLKITTSFTKTHSYLKQVITFIIATGLSIVYYYFVHLTLEQIIPTYLLSIAFYNTIVKKLLSLLNINYKQ